MRPVDLNRNCSAWLQSVGCHRDGTDVFFFTRDTLVAADENGNRVKIYDARIDGGFPQVPASIPCKASDECHGAGSQAPQEPEIKTVARTPNGNSLGRTSSEVREGFVKKTSAVASRSPAVGDGAIGHAAWLDRRRIPIDANEMREHARSGMHVLCRIGSRCIAVLAALLPSLLVGAFAAPLAGK